MTTLGTIADLFRFPIKSMQGERLDHSVIGPGGLAGDRGWAVREEAVGEIRGAKQLPTLLLCAARYLEEPEGDTIPHVQITLPDGTTLRSDDADVHERLSVFLGRAVTLWPLQPASDDAHYRRETPLTDEASLKHLLSREADESLPDLSGFDPTLVQEIVEYAAPRGTYFDVSPYHLLTTASVAALAALLPEATINVHRFRPNLYIETPPGVSGFVEFEWVGRPLRIGEASMVAGVPCPRCGMTAAAQPDLPKDASILRTIVRETGQNLGIYASMETQAVVRVGDTVKIA